MVKLKDQILISLDLLNYSFGILITSLKFILTGVPRRWQRVEELTCMEKLGLGTPFSLHIF